jgi:hypothetical protein
MGIVSALLMAVNYAYPGNPHCKKSLTVSPPFPLKPSKLWRRLEMNFSVSPITLRLIRVDLPKETEELITNLVDDKRYPAHEFKRLYNLRWGSEEFYKRIKHHQEIENVSGKSVQVVMQDFYAKILAGNLTAALAIAGHDCLEKTQIEGRPLYRINLAQAFAKMKQYQVKLWKLTGDSLASYLRIVDSIVVPIHRTRSPRSHVSQESQQAQ